MSCLEYRPNDIVLKVGDRTILAWDEVEVSRDNDAWENTSSTNGKTSQIHNPTPNGNVRLVIGQEGKEDWKYIRNLSDSASHFNIRGVDRSGTSDAFIAKDCHVQVQPTFNRSDGRVTYEANFPACDVQFNPQESSESPYQVGNTTSGQ